MARVIHLLLYLSNDPVSGMVSTYSDSITITAI